MNLPLQTFTALIQTSATALQGACAQLLDLTVGSVLRAVLEANASIALWIQWLIVLVLGTTRAATSSGPDLDTWMADYGLSRLPAAPAEGIVTFERFTPGGSALIPVGALVRTADASQSFVVVASSSNPAWNEALNGFVLAVGIASVDVPAQAVIPGGAGNVQAGTVTLLGSAIPGVDTVINAAPFTGGLDPESDAALRARFANYVATRSEATTAAVEYAISSIQQGLAAVVAENVDAQGNYRPGNFVVVVDDGTGSPPSSLLSACNTAVNAVRPIGSTYSILPPTIFTANVSLTITVAAGATKTMLQPVVAAALISYIDSLPIGTPLAYTRLAQIAYSASASVMNVSSVVLNSSNVDLVPNWSGVVKAGAVAVN
ncbi:MAG: baseplate J/gp47 family protein [Alphaproteobacteria bacterium]|nr:baseplate J/gp47 family protein [Alphaproteobacteria bacterium]